MPSRSGHVVIEAVRPELNGGRYRAKAVSGDLVQVTADIFRDGTGVLAAAIRYVSPSGTSGESPMALYDNDRWMGSFPVEELGRWRYMIEAWTDPFATWRRDLVKRADAGQVAELDLEEGALLIEESLARSPESSLPLLEAAVRALRGSAAADEDRSPGVQAALDPQLLELMSRHADRSAATTYRTLELTVDRRRARTGAWYEFFPRSTGPEGEHGTFRTAAEHLPTVAAMGFDVVYLPPIHPIGEINRKGKNNSLTPAPDDVGSPWAIGSRFGGHRSVDPKLGTLEDFDAFVGAAADAGLEVALDLALQCSPDHPWVKQHPEWFHHRPDGSIRYAENPPKKYEDIYPINFDTSDWEALWNEVKSVVDFWLSHGVRIFRVDNPHTKSFAFWEWLIEAVQNEHPDVIFLSEAFTRPKVMHLLAKLGFSQSYTYFTWRNTKQELIEYLTELTRTEAVDYFRPNFFTNTQDILHEYLQTGGPAAFKVRLALAALLSPSYGIYSGYEFFENIPLRKGSEEYLNSEKYELRHRSWEAEEETLIPYLRRVNQIRRDNPAFELLTNLRFHETQNDQVLAFSKSVAGRSPILAVVNLDPWHKQEAVVSLHEEPWARDESGYRFQELITATSCECRDKELRLVLDPGIEPVQIFAAGV